MKITKPTPLPKLVSLTLQKISTHLPIPSRYYLQRWVNLVLYPTKKTSEITLRIVDEIESAELNQLYRHKNEATNILAFPFEPPPGIPVKLLGDLVICAPLLSREAQEQGKSILAHWAHIVIHGCLHLLGYDHTKEQEAQRMENLEIELLQQLGYPNPYTIKN